MGSGGYPKTSQSKTMGGRRVESTPREKEKTIASSIGRALYPQTLTAKSTSFFFRGLGNILSEKKIARRNPEVNGRVILRE